MDSMEFQNMKADKYDPVAIHTHTFILLHDDKSNNQILCGMLRDALGLMGEDDIFPGVKFILPNGPFSATCDGDPSLRSWFWMDKLEEYDCYASKEIWMEVAETGYMLDMIIEAEAALIGHENVFVGGHGMGCAAGLSVLLQTEFAIGGFFGIGGFMPYVDDVKKIAFDGVTKEEEDYQRLQQADPNVEPDLAMVMDPDLLVPAAKGSSSQAQDGGEPATQPPEPLGQSSQDRLQRVVGFFRSFTWTSPELQPATTAVDTPIILVHAPDDPHIRLSHSKDALQMLQVLGFKARLVRPGKDEHKVTTDLLEALLVEVLNRQIGNWALREGIVESFQNSPRY